MIFICDESAYNESFRFSLKVCVPVVRRYLKYVHICRKKSNKKHEYKKQILLILCNCTYYIFSCCLIEIHDDLHY